MEAEFPRIRFALTAIVAAIGLAAAIWLCSLDKQGSALISIVACVAAGFLLNLVAFDSFGLNGTGLTAKMRTALTEAAATQDQLRALATLMARSSLTQSMAALLGPRTMSISTRLRLDMKVIDELRRMDVSDSQMNEARELWDRGVGVLFGRKLDQLLSIESIVRHQPDINPLDPTSHFVVNRPIIDVRAAVSQTIDEEEWNTPSVQVWRGLCASAEGTIPGVEALLSEYEAFQRTRALEAPELLDPIS